MKSNLVTLTKVLLKNGSGAELSSNRKRSRLLIAAILILSFTPLAFNFAHFFSMAYDAMKTIGQEGVILGLGLAISAFVIFFFGVFYVINSFYFSEDIETLLPLPLRPFEILGAKFIQVMLYEYITELIVLLPVLAIFAFKSGAGPVYYIYSLLVFALLPVIPLSLSSLIVMIVMRFTNLAKNKDRFRIVGGVIALVLALGVNMLIQRTTSKVLNAQELRNMLMQGKNSLIDITAKILPGTNWAAVGLAESGSIEGLLNIILFLAVTALFLTVFLLAGNLLYFKGVVGISQAAAAGRNMTNADIDRIIRRDPVMKSYIVKELKLLVRTPVYFLNCILMNFIWPVFLFIPALAQPDLMGQLDQIRSFIAGEGASGMVLAGGFGFIMFLASTNGITSSAISREGQTLFVCKYIPVSYKEQLLAKTYSGVIVALAGMIVAIVVGAALLRLPAGMLLLIFITGLLGILFNSFTGIILDLYSPKLNWDNEQKAVKQNFNVLLNMLVSIALAGLVILAAFKFELNLATLTLLLLGIVGLADICLYVFLVSKGVELFEKLEN